MTLQNPEKQRTNDSPEALRVGRVLELERQRIPNTTGDFVTRRLVAVGDESNPAERLMLRHIGDAYERDLLDHPEWQRPHNGRFDTNPASAWLYTDDPTQMSMQEWSMLFPSAKALYPLQRLNDGGRVLPGGVIDDRAKYLFTNMIDGIGLRSRARIMADIFTDVARVFDEDELTCVSLGCGAAVPNIDAARRMRQEFSTEINWHLYDTDRGALDFARELATEEGIPAHALDSYEGSFVRAFGREKPESAHAVDVLGLWEYLDDRTCVKLLQKSYQLLKPGGSFIASNMLSNRPQLQFCLRGVGWPDIKPRSEAELIAIVEQSGVMAGDGGGKLTITRPEDGVYGVMEIQKP